jgi:hypothetical protein
MKRTGVRRTIYLPDELAQRAKAADISSGRTLREAVEERPSEEPLGSDLLVSLPVERLLQMLAGLDRRVTS